MKPIQLIMMLGIFSFFGCNTTKKANDAPVIEKIKFYTGPCFGQCPVYTLTIMSDGMMKYEGKRFSEMNGVWQKTLGQNEYNDLVTVIEKANLRQYPDKVERKMSDISTKIIEFTDKEGSKQVEYSYINDEAILSMEQRIRAITKQEGWIQISKPVNISGFPDHFITDEIIIQFKKGTDPKAFAQRYGKQGGQIVRSISPPVNMWLFKYQEGTMTAKEMIADIKSQPEVVEAEFNKRVEMRGRE